MADLIRTDDVLAPHHLMELFTCGPEDEYDGPDLDECAAVPVCDGVWKLEPDGELWRFWRYLEDDETAFVKWIEELETDVLQDEYGYERGEFTVYPSHWRRLYEEGLTPSQAFKRALDAHRKARQP